MKKIQKMNIERMDPNSRSLNLFQINESRWKRKKEIVSYVPALVKNNAISIDLGLEPEQNES